MERHFDEELRDLKQLLLAMSHLVQVAVDKSARSFLTRDEEMAHQVIEGEERINRLEIEIDDKGHSLSARWQPMACDLRTLSMILKINTDLERMGDHAVNIAERTIFLLKEPPPPQDFHFPQMVNAVQEMMRDSFKAFVTEDAALARSVLKRDDEVDAYNDTIYYQLGLMMEENPATIQTGMSLVMISHNLERIADLANNIAEDVIYMKQGKEVRHRAEA
ncbi:MAG: phosphate signaling complex protein PhoU [Candidatus Omnitrophica bacterium]|nr:phosphate signaling complex protein PhoU [Candidatus Omnitrophota bacterium]